MTDRLTLVDVERSAACGEARDHLAELVDGELEPAVAASVREHVAGCAACRAAVAERTALKAAVRRATPLVPAPAALRAQIAAAASLGRARHDPSHSRQ